AAGDRRRAVQVRNASDGLWRSTVSTLAGLATLSVRRSIALRWTPSRRATALLLPPHAAIACAISASVTASSLLSTDRRRTACISDASGGSALSLARSTGLSLSRKRRRRSGETTSAS